MWAPACEGAGETLGATTSAAGDLAKGVTDAAGTVARLPLTNVVTGHGNCAPLAPNGAPDCGGASIALCKSKGFAARQHPRHHRRAQVPGAAWREGRAPNAEMRQRVVRLARDVPVAAAVMAREAASSGQLDVAVNR